MLKSFLATCWQSVRKLFTKIFTHVRTTNIAHRALDPELNPETQRMMMNILHRGNHDWRRMLLWRRFALIMFLLILAYAWVNLREKTTSDLQIDQKPFRTVLVTGSGWSTAHVAVIPIRGSIEGDPLGAADMQNTVRYISDTLDLAKKEDNLAAVVIYIESGGGDMYASIESYRLVHNFRKKMKIPVYAYIPRGAYSGAYYIALGTGEIIADPVAEIGNIGVIVHRLNTYRLGRRLGIQMDSIKTGQHKDAGGQWKRPTAGDRALDQRAIDVMFEYFLEAVAESRPMYSLEELKKEAKKQGGVTSGAWFVARDAKEKGLIDQSLTFEEFLTYVTGNISKNDKRKFRNVEFVKYDEKLSVLDDWKSHFNNVKQSTPAKKKTASEDLSSCLLSTNLANQIFRGSE